MNPYESPSTMEVTKTAPLRHAMAAAVIPFGVLIIIVGLWLADTCFPQWSLVDNYFFPIGLLAVLVVGCLYCSSVLLYCRSFLAISAFMLCLFELIVVYRIKFHPLVELLF